MTIIPRVVFRFQFLKVVDWANDQQKYWHHHPPPTSPALTRLKTAESPGWVVSINNWMCFQCYPWRCKLSADKNPKSPWRHLLSCWNVLSVTCAMDTHLLLTHCLSVQVHVPHWFWLWRPWSIPHHVQLTVSVDLRGGGGWGRGGGRDRWRGGGGSTTRVCRRGRWRGDRWRVNRVVAAERLLPQCLIFWGQFLPLPPHIGQLLGQGVQPLPQLTNFVTCTVTLRTNLQKIYTNRRNIWAPSIWVPRHQPLTAVFFKAEVALMESASEQYMDFLSIAWYETRICPNKSVSILIIYPMP